nr:ABC transporter permease [Legionella jordanis]
MSEIRLSKQEEQWIIEQRITRLTDNEEALIYPMGAERFLASVLSGAREDRYNIGKDIKEKDVLLVPGYGNTAFLFAEAGAKSVTVCDKDPVTIAWIKAFKKYYHYRECIKGKNYPTIGELLTALTKWYPPLIILPKIKLRTILFWFIRPKALRRIYIVYLLQLVRAAVLSKVNDQFELQKSIIFYAKEIKQLLKSDKCLTFDTAYVPYLLAVNNGIEKEKDVVRFIQQLLELVPNGHILVTPSQRTKEFYLGGQSYFVTTGHPDIQSIPGLKNHFLGEDKYWFNTQGLAIFGKVKL